MEKHGFLKVAGNKVVDQPLAWSVTKSSVSGDENRIRIFSQREERGKLRQSIRGVPSVLTPKF